MPLQKHNETKTFLKRFTPKDSVVLKLPKLIKDAGDDKVYPQEVLKAFIKYFNGLYQFRSVFGERFIVDGPEASHMDLYVYVPGELSREDFLDDLADFLEDYPGVKGEIIKKWPKAKEWNEAHKEEIASGEVKARQEGIKMAKSTAGAHPIIKFKTLLGYAMEEEPKHPYPGISVEELEELEAKKDPALKKYFEELSKYDEHQGDLRPLMLAFEKAYGTKFDKNDPDDIEALEFVYNEDYANIIEEERDTYTADVRLSFPIGQFAPGREGNVDLQLLYDKKVKDIPNINTIQAKKDKINDDEGVDDVMLRICKLMGEAHDKIIEAQELASDLYDAGMINSNLEYILEDLEADLSQVDFMGEDKPTLKLMEEFAGEIEEPDENEFNFDEDDEE